MKLDGIAAFVAVAGAGSISEAARRLGLSKSVVSERLAELERSVGATLLHRTTRKLSLTEDGSPGNDTLIGSAGNDQLLGEVLAQATMLSALTRPVVPAATDAKTIALDPEGIRRTLQ